MIRAFIDYEFRNFKKNNYLLCGGNFFSIKNSCLRVLGLYFLSFSLSLAFSPFVGFCIINKFTIGITFRNHTNFKMSFFCHDFLILKFYLVFFLF